jgi:phosphatidylethanolamine-binding protein (PEBP) family uncharacterized protein
MKSFALIVDDPDAPRGTWVHWVVWNIGPDTTEIPAKSVPRGALQGTNDFGKQSYGGPLPTFRRGGRMKAQESGVGSDGAGSPALHHGSGSAAHPASSSYVPARTVVPL